MGDRIFFVKTGIGDCHEIIAVGKTVIFAVPER
jgi:hypothetical protein